MESEFGYAPKTLSSFSRNAVTKYAPQGVPPQPAGREPVLCNIRPECKACGYASHGFLCHFRDGSCMRYGPRTTLKEAKHDEVNGKE